MKYTILTRALALIFLAAAPAALAQTPALLNYQGRVQTGTPPADFTGTGQFNFALVDQSPVPFVQATATVTRAAGVQSLAGATFTVSNGGTGYTTAPAVTVSAPQVGGGVQATVTAIVSGGSVTDFTVGIAGSGYTANPTLTIAPPPAPTPTITWNNDGPAPAAPVNPVSLPVTNGLYSVLLGDTSNTNMAAIPPSVFSRPDVRLRVWFNGQQLSPDQRLAPTGYLATPSEFKVFKSGTSGSLIDPAADIVLEDYRNSFVQINAFWQEEAGVLFGRPDGARHGGIIYNDTVAGNGLRFLTGNGGTRMTIAGNGNVGIGTISPTQAKLVVNGSQNSQPVAGNKGLLNASGAQVVAQGADNNSIFASGVIWAGTAVVASSDERIKTIQGRSHSPKDLEMLRSIEITDYLYKDKFTKGGAAQKKVIAQQVEKVFPQAVSKQTDVVPDIYEKADYQDGWVALQTDLKKGERVRLTDDKTTDVFEVLEVAEGKFRTAFKPEGDKVFVYGREVNDFRTVDYEAIAMLNVSATQELARQLEAEKATTAALTERLAKLEAKDADRDAKLAALMKMMEDRGGEAEAATVSTVTTQQ